MTYAEWPLGRESRKVANWILIDLATLATFPIEAFSTGLGDQVSLDEVLVDGHPQAGPVRRPHPPVHRLHPLDGQLVPQRRVLDAVLKHEGVPAGAQPVGARGDGDRAGVAVVAQAGTDLLDAGPDVRRV